MKNKQRGNANRRKANCLREAGHNRCTEESVRVARGERYQTSQQKTVRCRETTDGDAANRWPLRVPAQRELPHQHRNQSSLSPAVADLVSL
jgi:hypothetical protein